MIWIKITCSPGLNASNSTIRQWILLVVWNRNIRAKKIILTDRFVSLRLNLFLFVHDKVILVSYARRRLIRCEPKDLIMMRVHLFESALEVSINRRRIHLAGLVYIVILICVRCHNARTREFRFILMDRLLRRPLIGTRLNWRV